MSVVSGISRPLLSGVAAALILVAASFVRMTVQPGIRDAGNTDDLIGASAGWADESRCVDCHEQALEFHRTGHANTLLPASDQDSLELLRELAGSPIGTREQVAVSADDGQVRLHRTSDGITSSVTLDWCVGSGAHARTWISTLPDALGSTDLLELRWTWFRSGEDFVSTPGHPEFTGNGAIARMGLLFDGPRAWRCFSCHATRLPEADGAIGESQIAAGVTCQRCHGPRARHVASEGNYHDPAWVAGDRDESVAKCAQCHRRPDEFDAAEVRPDNPDIVRFQPVGLLQSRCFTESQMTCTTCHDPHRPMSEQDSRNIRQCVQCHDPEIDRHTLCAASMTERCLECHMPAVEAVPGLPFTDHWIRVHRESE